MLHFSSTLILSDHCHGYCRTQLFSDLVFYTLTFIRFVYKMSASNHNQQPPFNVEYEALYDYLIRNWDTLSKQDRLNLLARMRTIHLNQQPAEKPSYESTR